MLLFLLPKKQYILHYIYLEGDINSQLLGSTTDSLKLGCFILKFIFKCTTLVCLMLVDFLWVIAFTCFSSVYQFCPSCLIVFSRLCLVTWFVQFVFVFYVCLCQIPLFVCVCCLAFRALRCSSCRYFVNKYRVFKFLPACLLSFQHSGPLASSQRDRYDKLMPSSASNRHCIEGDLHLEWLC